MNKIAEIKENMPLVNYITNTYLDTAKTLINDPDPRKLDLYVHTKYSDILRKTFKQEIDWRINEKTILIAQIPYEHSNIYPVTINGINIKVYFTEDNVCISRTNDYFPDLETILKQKQI